LYKKISKHPNPRDVYINKLVEGRSIEVELAQTMEREFKNELQDRFNSVKQKTVPFEPQSPDKEWANLHRAQKKDFELSYPTGVSREQLEEVYHALVKVPDDIKPIRKALKVIEDRKKKWNQSRLDWGMAELLAYGCMLRDGINIRMSGQDCIRGTFSHRHAMVFDENANKKYHTLNHINKDQAKFRIYNSLLSEYAVLAYEYGYSLGRPTDINIWEAQFGDFANGAQTVFDQFVSAGESKWQRMSGLITYLPHGYEGQGPEHSNARPERFLQLAAEYNMIVANCTTPANLFHLLRRHVSWPFRKPLVLFTPKSLLRHPACVSTIEELTNQGFQEVIEDPRDHTGRTIIFCSGKVFYDLDEYRQAHKLSHVGIYRMEQLYPFPQKHIKDIMDRYPGAEFKWVQEEPENMGAWSYLHRFEETRSWSLVGRKISASPATGFGKIHKQEQTYIIKKALE
jgi:2-oxoglutarate dehydrogenase E1 component